MKSIDTFYNGNFYRSRLEARWAYFFDLCGVKYLYEPEGFKNGNNEMYLPDFYLPETYLRDGFNIPYIENEDNNAWEKRFNEAVKEKGVYIEIKHEFYNQNDFKKDWFNKNLVLFPGTPLNHIFTDYGYNCHNDGGYQMYPWWDNYMKFWICKKCKTSKIEFSEGNYDDCPECGGLCDNSLLVNSANQASIKRFEHLTP